MERRFVRVWREMESRVDEGESFVDVLQSASTRALIAALAGAGTSGNDMAANAIATELLNRIQRAPFLGAAVASVATVLVLLVSDFVLTGWPLFSTATPRTYVILAYSIIASLFSAIMWLLWRGHFPKVRFLMDRRKGDY